MPPVHPGDYLTDWATTAAMMSELDPIVSIERFTFDPGSLRYGADGALLWAICRWGSIGHDPNGATFDRPGRATVILERRDGALKALHTHFSLVPRPT
jgi:hypothetical protein